MTASEYTKSYIFFPVKSRFTFNGSAQGNDERLQVDAVVVTNYASSKESDLLMKFPIFLPFIKSLLYLQHLIIFLLSTLDRQFNSSSRSIIQLLRYVYAIWKSTLLLLLLLLVRTLNFDFR